MALQRYHPAKHQETEDVPDRVIRLDPQLLREEAYEQMPFLLQPPAGNASSPKQLEGPAFDDNMPLSQIKPTVHSQPLHHSPPYLQLNNAPHTPPATPPTSPDASAGHAEPKKDAPKKDPRTKPPMVWQKLLKKGQRVTNANELAHLRREAQRINRNRASAAKSREERKLRDEKNAVELAELQVKVNRLEREKDGTTEEETDDELIELRVLVRTLKHENANLKAHSGLGPGDYLVITLPARSNEDVLQLVNSNLDFQMSMPMPVRFHHIGANRNFIGNLGDTLYLSPYSNSLPAQFIQNQNAAITQSGAHLQVAAGGRDPADVHDPYVLFCRCRACTARDRASRAANAQSRAHTQQSVSQIQLSAPPLAAAHGSVIALRQDVSDMPNGATAGPVSPSQDSEDVMYHRVRSKLNSRDSRALQKGNGCHRNKWPPGWEYVR